MPLWGSSNVKAKAPKYKVIESQVAAGPSKGNNNAFNNTSIGVFKPHQTLGVFGANDQNTSASVRIPHAGWQLVRQGTGPVKNFTISVGGTGFANTDLVKVSGGEVNASATVSTNATGGIATLTITAGGLGFMNVSTSTVAFTNSTGGASAGSGATVVPILGGRAGRIHYECLVALTKMQGSPPATLP
jgi:hypothetical protein